MTSNLSDHQLPLVSIVLPVFNGEKYLKESLDSVFAQTYKNWELIIINDGSTDGTEKIIQTYHDKRIKYLPNDGNKGIIFSLNRGLQESNGHFIARLDADDVALPLRLEKQVEFLMENSDYVICGSYFQTVDSKDKLLKKVRFPSNDRDARSFLLLHNCFCHSTILMRAEIVKELKYDEYFEICEDYDLWVRISRSGKILNLPIFTTLYRVHGNNISTTKHDVMFAHVHIINQRILDNLGIEYSSSELNVHSNALCYNASFFKNRGNINLLENWMLKLYKYIKKHKDYNSFVCYTILVEKWIVASYNSGNIKKLFFNKLVWINPAVFLYNLARKVKKKI